MERYVLQASDCKSHWKTWQEAKDAFIASSKTKLVRFITAMAPFNNEFREVQLEMTALFGTNSITLIQANHPMWPEYLPLKNKIVERIFLDVLDSFFALFIVHRFPHPEIDALAQVVMERKQRERILNRDLALETLRYLYKRKLSKFEVRKLTVNYESKRLVYRYYDPNTDTFGFQNRTTLLVVPNILRYYHVLESIFHTYIPFLVTIMDYVAPHDHVASYLTRPTIVCK